MGWASVQSAVSHLLEKHCWKINQEVGQAGSYTTSKWSCLCCVCNLDRRSKITIFKMPSAWLAYTGHISLIDHWAFNNVPVTREVTCTDRKQSRMLKGWFKKCSPKRILAVFEELKRRNCILNLIQIRVSGVKLCLIFLFRHGRITGLFWSFIEIGFDFLKNMIKHFLSYIFHIYYK